MAIDSKDTFRFIDSDPIEPSDIEHNVDELFDDWRLEQRYNFIDYYFESPTSCMLARAYLDTSDTVAILGPFESRDSRIEVNDDALQNRVFTYLSRRFHFIKILDKEGYELVWQAQPLPPEL